jgi:LysM repeat protein
MNKSISLVDRHIVRVLSAAVLLMILLVAGCSPSPAQNETEIPTPEEMEFTNTPTPTNIPTATETQLPTNTPEPTEPSILTYAVQAGDTFIGIAGQFGTNLATLSALNPDVTPGEINVGDELSVPGLGGVVDATPVAPGAQTVIEYQVVAGDSLASIAERFGSTITAIVTENGLEDANQIFVGQTLRIPVISAAPTASP